MKKILLLFLSIVTLISLTACNFEADVEIDTDTAAEETTSTKENVDEEETFVDIDDSFDDEDDEKSVEEKEVIVEALAGKTLTEAIAEGYNLDGYVVAENTDDVYILNLAGAADDETEKLKKSIEGITVAELIETYDVYIGYDYDLDNSYVFSIDIASVTFEFELENGATAVENHADDPFLELNEAEEIQYDTLKNVTVSKVCILAELDEESNNKLKQLEYVDTEIIESMTEEMVISRAYYLTLDITE